MMTKTRQGGTALCAALALAGLGLTTPATAYVVKYTYTGVITNGNYDDNYDHLGIFGAPTNLNGHAFKLVYTLNSTFGDIVTFQDSTSDKQTYRAVGSGFNPNPLAQLTPVTADLTLGGVTYHFDGEKNPSDASSTFSFSQINVGYLFTDTEQNAKHGGDLNSYVDIFARSFNFVQPDHFNHSYTIEFDNPAGSQTRDPNFYTDGAFYIRPTSADLLSFTHGAFAADKLVVTVSDGVSGVPEPGTWGITLLGFGLLGARLRARRAQSSRLQLRRIATQQ